MTLLGFATVAIGIPLLLLLALIGFATIVLLVATLVKAIKDGAQ